MQDPLARREKFGILIDTSQILSVNWEPDNRMPCVDLISEGNLNILHSYIS